MMFNNENYKDYDQELWEAIQAEEDRQEHNIELIASENMVSKAVMQAQGSVLTNKYAEGYPSKRYYGGTEYVDIVESLAIERAKSSLVQPMQTFSLILVVRPMLLLIWH